MSQREIDRALNEFLAQHRGLSRRSLIRGGMGLALASILNPYVDARAQVVKPRFSAYPFTLGVAAGYPTPDGFTIWTRLAPEPLQANGGMWFDFVMVDWQVAEDEQFTRIVAENSVRAVPELAHSVHVDVSGLRSDRWYFYRFRSGDELSRTGRARTLPATDARNARLRLGFASCQHYEQAYFSGHRHLQAENLDLMLFLGDYIYESNWGDHLVRRHIGDEAYHLADYRIRHAQYKCDVDLQNHHAHLPFVFCWDDHEVDNDYTDWRSEHLDPAFLTRRAAAYQAYYEHMPVPRRMIPRGADMPIHTHLDFGGLARIYLLDNRQYRTPQPCPSEAKGGGSTDVNERLCPALFDPKQSVLGAAQEQWLSARFADSKSRWNLIAQQTIFGRFDTEIGPERRRFTDGWDGYPLARQRLLADLKRRRLSNPAIIGGDIHGFAVTEIREKPDDFDSPVQVPEFCGTSIGSQSWPDPATFAKRKDENPDIVFANNQRRGYAVAEITDKMALFELRELADEKQRDTGVSTVKRFSVRDGSPRIETA